MIDKEKYFFQNINTEPLEFPFPTPEGKNSISSLKKLFEDRKYYSNYAVQYVNQQLGNKEIFCNLIGKNALFGLVDEYMNAIEYIGGPQEMKEIPSIDPKPKYVLPFLADAFNEMNDYLKTAGMLGKMSKKSVFYNLKAHSAYYSLNDKIKLVEQRYKTEFNNYIFNNKEKSAKINNAKSFNKVFVDFVKMFLKQGLPITKTGILFANNFFTHINGLTIDIAKDKADDDSIKFEKYFLDNDFPIFADACKRFGFLIDVNVPWRLIPNFNSPAMKEITGTHKGYLLRYGMTNYSDVINLYYKPIRDSEIQHLISFFYNVYSFLLEKQSFYQEDLKNKTSCDKTPFLLRESITFDKYLKLFPMSYWSRIYVYIRNIEEQKGLNQQQFENIVREANRFIELDRMHEAMFFINNYFKSFANVRYFSTLQNTNGDVEQKIESRHIPELIL